MKNEETKMFNENCCLSFAGDSDDHTFMLLIGHHPRCPLLDGFPKRNRRDFAHALDSLYAFWKKTELDKIRNEFYAKSLPEKGETNA